MTFGTIYEPLYLYEEAKNIFSRASMNLHDWTSNSDKFVHCLPEKKRLNGQVIKMLGLIWDQIEDYLQIPSFKVSLDEYDITKRQVLSDISKTYVTGPAKIDHVSANYTELYFR